MHRTITAINIYPTMERRSAILTRFLTGSFIFVYALSAHAGPSSAARCHELFFEPYTVEKLKTDQPHLVKLGHHSTYIKDFLAKTLSSLDNPYDIVSDIAKTSLERKYELRDLYQILFKSNSEAALYRHLSRWVKSDRHALLMYDFLYESESDLFHSFLGSWAGKHPFFRKTILGTTMSFEKEDPAETSKGLSDWYKLSEVSDSEWQKKDSKEKFRLLYDAKAEGVVATQNKPYFLSPLKQDIPNLEVTHKKYEIDPEVIFKQLSEVTRANGNTRSIHFHIVFSLPQNYPKVHYDAFINWLKYQNDHLVVAGLEEGLHLNQFIGFAKNPFRSHPSFDPDPKEFLETLSPGENTKMINLGLRAAATYTSRTLHRGKVNIGLEVREGTKDLAKLKLTVDRLASDINHRTWEGWTTKNAIDENVFEIYIRKGSVDFLSWFDNPAFLQVFNNHSPLKLPFLNFEEKRFYDYKSKRLIEITEEQKNRIIVARKNYRSAIQATYGEFLKVYGKPRFFLTGEDAVIVEQALKWSLADWAKEAKISELFFLK